MVSLVGKCAPVLASVRTVPLSAEKNLLISVVPRKRTVLPLGTNFLTVESLQRTLPQRNTALSSCSLAAPLQLRFVHTDVTNIPDFSDYRTSSTKRSDVKSADSEAERKIFSYTMMLTGAVLATTAAKYSVKTLLMPLGPSAKTLAEASTEVNLASIAEGKNAVVKWRNKPLFVRHRTQEEITRERAVPLSHLRHPERDEDRVKQDKWLICLGVCTHLGCVPISHAGEYAGGYYCPCHGSHYDASGRIRKGPAPLNLEVPEYKFLDDNTILVG